MGSRYESGVNTMGVLSRTEQKLVEEHLYLIRPLVLNVVHLNENVQGLGYDDLYQTACEALCHAAMKYQDSRGASFPTFASIVICNTLLSHCRSISRIQTHLEYLDAPAASDSTLTYTEILADETQPMPDGTDSEALGLLKDARLRYSGSARKGIEALYLKCLGHTNMEIAENCGVRPNLVAAWISKAAGKLRKDKRFIYLLRT